MESARSHAPATPDSPSKNPFGALPSGSLGAFPPEEIARVGATAWVRVVAAWHLDTASAAALAGVSPRTWARMKSGAWRGRLDQDQLARFSALIGLYKGLHLYFGDALADRWPLLENTGPPFGGRSPVDFMRDGGLPAILDTRGYIDAVRGGV